LPDELPPNKVCPRCGAENLATAANCLECGAWLRSGIGPREEVLRIDGKSGAVLPPRRSAWGGFFRVMSVPGCTVLAFALCPAFEEKAVVASVAFLAAAILAITAARASDARDWGERGPHDGWLIVDGLLRGIGCLFAAVLAVVLSIWIFLFTVCYCGTRR
jgi:hypothetical protein